MNEAEQRQALAHSAQRSGVQENEVIFSGHPVDEAPEATFCQECRWIVDNPPRYGNIDEARLSPAVGVLLVAFWHPLKRQLATVEEKVAQAWSLFDAKLSRKHRASEVGLQDYD